MAEDSKGRISALAIGVKKANQSGTNGSTIRLLKLYEVSVNPASLAAGASEAVAVTVSGITTDDVIVSVEPQAALNAGVTIDYARVSAADTVVIAVTNTTAGIIDVAATNFKILAARIADADV